MKTLIWMLVIGMMAITTRAQDTQTDYSEAFKLMEVWMDAQRDYERVPGMSAIVVQDQEVLWSGAFGMANLEDQVKATPSTLYSICSISKLFTSVAIMKLYDEGKLRLDDEIQDLLPWYDLKQQFPDSWPITVRSLLTHSSGLPRESNHPYWTGPDHPFPENEAIRSELHNQETLYPSSTVFQYSNLGMTLLGEVVEEISGMPYEEYIMLNILDLLDLHDTRTFLPEELYGSELAIGYSALDREGSRSKVDLFQARGITAAAGFSSNVFDLGKFASWQFRLLDTSTTEILHPSTLRYMHNVHWTDPDWKTTWGLGFGVIKGPDGVKRVGHSGGCPGYITMFSMIPSMKRAYAVFTNGINTNPLGFIQAMDSLMDKYKKDGNNEKVENTVPSLDEYTGYYHQMPWTSEVYLSTWHNKLVMLPLPTKDPVQELVFLRYLGEDTFKRLKDNGELGETFTFIRDENGATQKIKRHNNYFSRIHK